MSSYHAQTAPGERPDESRVTLSISARDALEVKAGLLELAVRMGLLTLRELMEEEVTRLCGPKGKHLKENRRANRHGAEKGSVVLGGRKVSVERPRVRTVDGREVPLETYRTFQDGEVLTEMALERMLHGLSCRRYRHGLEPVGEEGYGTSKSTISRRFVAATERQLAELLSRPLGDLGLVALMIDGIVLAGHTVVCALGIGRGGSKHALGLWEGATENATVCKALLADLVERGLDASQGLLVVIDGSKALRAAVEATWGGMAVVQRCQEHKKRNVLEHLPKSKRVRIQRELNEAWGKADADAACSALESLARRLQVEHPGAAASLREGLEETLTVIALGVPAALQRSLRSTNAIESMQSMLRDATRNVKRWRNGRQALRWTAAGLLEAERRFRRIRGYRHLPDLAAALQRRVHAQEEGEQGRKTA